MFLKCIFIYFEREREREQCMHKQEKGRESGRERIASRLCTVSTEPDIGLELTNDEIMT